MQNDTTAEVDSRRRLPCLLTALVVLGVTAPFIWQLVGIQLRLSRNGALARRLVESLHDRFPGVGFSGAASYESEIIYITAIDHLEGTARQDIEQWLRRQKTEQKIMPEIWLSFSYGADDDSTIKIGSLSKGERGRRMGCSYFPWQ